MDIHSFPGKRDLCYTEVSDFTDIQGIGSHPLYKRFGSVFSVIKNSIPQDFHHFLATPKHTEDDDRIYWYIDSWTEEPTKLTDLSGEERAKYEEIKNKTVCEYKKPLNTLAGDELIILANATKHISDDFIFCADNKVFLIAWGMAQDTNKHKVTGSIIHAIEKTVKVNFNPGEHGKIVEGAKCYITKKFNSTLSDDEIPNVIANDEWTFTGWNPPTENLKLTADTAFTATYERQEEKPIVTDVNETAETKTEPEEYECRFEAGEHGTINSQNTYTKQYGESLSDGEIPIVSPQKGYEFTGWDYEPSSYRFGSNKVFTAQYKENTPWYKKLWLWLTGTGCLKSLMWIPISIIAFFLLAWLFKSCNGCSREAESLGSFTRPDGTIADDNGRITPITGDLPDRDFIAAPITEEDGSVIPIIKNPGVPDKIANRLFLFMEDENGDIDALAEDFKKAYSSDKYSIIGFDKEVKLLVIQIPENEREKIRLELENKLPNHKFLVFCEEIYELRGYESLSNAEKGWHLDAINLKKGWQHTKGSPDIKIAIVDDGIQADHQMFKNRITEPYNVFTQDNRLSMGTGHGTHTAGLAAGSADFYETEHASGVAPECLIMPIQVFDNNLCPLSALVAGVMYAVHHNADVVNISIGPSFRGLNMLPISEQENIAYGNFKNVEHLWRRVCGIAKKKNCILVFAAGNDDILTSIPPGNRNKSSITVTAVEQHLYPTKFTNYGTCSDVSAPGQSIHSSFPESSFKTLDGTSMAAPIITGTIALMKCIKKDLTVDQARNAIYNSGADVYGWIPPMVLVDKAIEATKNGNFAKTQRKGKRVPDGVDVHLDKGRLPGMPIKDKTPESFKTPDRGYNADDTKDHEAIKKLIEEYKQKIKELEDQLNN